MERERYVMVPVPEHLFDETMRFLMGLDMRALADKKSVSLDAGAVPPFLDRLNPACRGALEVLAAWSAGGRHATVADLADATGLPPVEAAGVVIELTALTSAEFGPMVTMVVNRPPDNTTGSLDWSGRTVVVWRALAEAVLDAGAAVGAASGDDGSPSEA